MKQFKQVISIALVVALIFVSSSATIINAKTIKKSGKYYTELKTKGIKSAKYDVYAKKITFKKNKMTITGKLQTGKKKILKAANRTFVFSKKCKFYKGVYVVDTGKYKLKKTSKSKLIKKAKKLTKGSEADTGQSLTWKVKNGKVVKIAYTTDEYTDVNFHEEETDENGQPL